MNKFTAKWQVDDGYAGGARPQSTGISEDDILDCESIDDAMTEIENIIREDFLNRISWGFSNYDRVKAWAEQVLANKAQSL
jgi:hypothetical protein